MLDLGGEEKRRQLLARVRSNRIAEGGSDLMVAQEAQLNAEESKVQAQGDIGQGNRLTDAKKAAQMRKK